MNQPLPQDWDPTSAAALLDQRATFDDLRERCPVAHSDFLGWSLFRHADVVRVLNDAATFSSVVSRHLSVPNGMDPPEHAGYRRIVELYFQPARMQAFEAPCREIAASLVRDLAGPGEVEFIGALAQSFAVRSSWRGLPYKPTLEMTASSPCPSRIRITSRATCCSSSNCFPKTKPPPRHEQRARTHRHPASAPSCAERAPALSRLGPDWRGGDFQGH